MAMEDLPTNLAMQRVDAKPIAEAAALALGGASKSTGQVLTAAVGDEDWEVHMEAHGCYKGLV